MSGREGFSYVMAVPVLPWSGHQTSTGIVAWSGEPFNAPLRCFPLGICSPECAGKCDWYEQGCAKCVFVYRNNYAGAMLSACTVRLVLLCLSQCWLIPCLTCMPLCINKPKYQPRIVRDASFPHGLQRFQTQTRLQILRENTCFRLPPSQVIPCSFCWCSLTGKSVWTGRTCLLFV